MAVATKHRPTKRHGAQKTQQVIFALLSAQGDDVFHLAKEAISLGITRKEVAALLDISARDLAKILRPTNA